MTHPAIYLNGCDELEFYLYKIHTYNTIMDQLLSSLNDRGYTIIPDILNETECNELVDAFWNYWGWLSDGAINRDDTWTWDNLLKFCPRHGMLVQNYYSGHMQKIWDLRCHAGVKSVYSAIWNTDELTTSFDGISTSLPPEIIGEGFHENDWLHLDQSPHRNDFECVQGWVTPIDVGAEDGTLVVLENSHRFHGEFAQHFGLKQNRKFAKDWFRLQPEHIQWFLDKGCRRVCIECPKGSMVVWDSRTVHCGKGPTLGRAEPNIRMVSYISMMPLSMLNKKDMVKKKKALLKGQLTSHWAAKNVTLFPIIPKIRGANIPQIKPYQPPKLTMEGVLLSGWVEQPETCPLLIEDAEERRLACLEQIPMVEQEWQDVCRIKKK